MRGLNCKVLETKPPYILVYFMVKNQQLFLRRLQGLPKSFTLGEALEKVPSTYTCTHK
jgi:hypothetical protein